MCSHDRHIICVASLLSPYNFTQLRLKRGIKKKKKMPSAHFCLCSTVRHSGTQAQTYEKYTSVGKCVLYARVYTRTIDTLSLVLQYGSARHETGLLPRVYKICCLYIQNQMRMFIYSCRAGSDAQCSNSTNVVSSSFFLNKLNSSQIISMIYNSIASQPQNTIEHNIEYELFL